MTQEQYQELINTYGTNNIAIKQMRLLHNYCGKEVKDLNYQNIRIAAKSYDKHPIIRN